MRDTAKEQLFALSQQQWHVDAHLNAQKIVFIYLLEVGEDDVHKWFINF